MDHLAKLASTDPAIERQLLQNLANELSRRLRFTNETTVAVTARAIVISNALFSSAHLHLSVSFALFAFFPGLLWGALFARQGNIVGVAASHILCGWFAFFVLGFEPWY
jgi:membrane protease YdiL (CAAX protease family)